MSRSLSPPSWPIQASPSSSSTASSATITQLTLPSLPQSSRRPSRGNLRVNTDFGRYRSSSQAPQPQLSEIEQQPGMSHQASRSMSHASANSQNPLSHQDVMLAVQGLRDTDTNLSPLRSGVSVSPSPNSERPITPSEELSQRRIREAVERSPDEGDTLDLSRRGIDNIGPGVVETFRTGVGRKDRGVERLALSYNALKDGCIDSSFASLSRLRYLNLKGNAFTEFPPALTEMPALEILDLSKNSITAFPLVPSQLCHLKVLSLTKNKISRLPSYLSTFSGLRVFKVDHNPIDWPPPDVLGPLATSETNGDLTSSRSRRDENLKPWIDNMKQWMLSSEAETEKLLERSRAEQDDTYDEPPSAISTDEPISAGPWTHHSSSSLVALASQQTIKPLREDIASPPRLLVRNRSATVSNDTLLTSLPSSSTSIGTNTPPASASTSSFQSSTSSSRNLPLPPPIQSTNHTRGASYTATQRNSANLTAKKSLPDLRQSHAKILQERRESAEQTRQLALGIESPVKTPLKSPPWGGMGMMKSPTSAGPSRPSHFPRKSSMDMLKHAVFQQKQNQPEQNRTDESHNSYFRRMSTLPISSISKTIPTVLLQIIDAARGILFALSQLQTALRQYLVFAATDRVAGVFRRVMEPASKYLDTLINALDRFDSMSRRNTPPITAIASVLSATKESVSVFTKIVAVFKLQLPAIKGTDERYTRTLLLMIYGSMAEIATSWKTVTPLITEIKPMLISTPSRPLGGHKMMPSGSFVGRTPISPIPERGESHTPSSLARSSTAAGNSPYPTVDDSPAPSRLASANRSRRQGGSFSTQDVERGMLMGSPGGPQEVSGYIRHKATPSASTVIEEQEESELEEETLAPLPFTLKNGVSNSSSHVPITPPELNQNPQPVAMVPTTSQLSRHGHKQSSSSGSNGLSLPPPMRKLSVDIRPVTPASATLYDEDLFDLLEKATDIAFTVWLRLSEDIDSGSPMYGHSKSSSQGSILSQLDSAKSVPFTPIDQRRPIDISPRHHAELSQLLSSSEQITTTLRESLMGLRADPQSHHQTTLPDDVQAFVKAVVKVSEMVKIVSSSHTFSSSVRQLLSRLMQATRECAILIQVSSLRPGTSTPAPVTAMIPTSARSHSPMLFTRSNQGVSRSIGGGGSTDDLTTPISAVHSSNWGQPSGLRGLQLPSKHAALGRTRSGGTLERMNTDMSVNAGGGYYHGP